MANRGHKLMTKEILNRIPGLYAQDGAGENAIVHVKFFTPFSGFTWYCTEYDPEQKIFFAWVTSHLCPEGEFGYVSLDELETLTWRGMPAVERDLYWSKTTVKNCPRFGG